MRQNKTESTSKHKNSIISSHQRTDWSVFAGHLRSDLSIVLFLLYTEQFYLWTYIYK